MPVVVMVIVSVVVWIVGLYLLLRAVRWGLGVFGATRPRTAADGGNVGWMGADGSSDCSDGGSSGGGDCGGGDGGGGGD